MRRWGVAGWVVLWLFLQWPWGVVAEEGGEKKWKAGLFLSYDRGDFGTADTSETLYVPLTLKRLFSRGEVGLTVPFLSVRSTGQTVVVGGVLQQNRRGGRVA